MSLPPASVDASFQTTQFTCLLTHSALDIPNIITSVQDVTAGASAVFIGFVFNSLYSKPLGTTRNSFKGKMVTRLEYQAYSALAIKTMSEIVQKAIDATSQTQTILGQIQPPPTIRCAIHHRLGSVPIGLPSIVIAVSSPHRKEAFVVCEQILEDVKNKVQIWKREYYEGEDEQLAVWKSNWA